jgi:hypothetical protein
MIGKQTNLIAMIMLHECIVMTVKPCKLTYNDMRISQFEYLIKKYKSITPDVRE